MRFFLLFLLFTFCSISNAGEIYFANYESNKYSIDIGSGYGGCKSPVCIVVRKGNTSNSYSFEKECVLTKNGKKIKPTEYGTEYDEDTDGFFCHAKGHTPLAGATYKFILFGRSSHDDSCGIGPSKFRSPAEKYICVKGCENPSVPEYLNADSLSC